MTDRPVIRALFEQLHSSLESGPAELCFGDGRPVMIYGAGNIGKDVFRLLNGQGFPVIGFIDHSAAPGSAWRGVPIFRPEDSAISASERANTHVVLGLFNPYVDIPPIQALLKSLGFRSITSFMRLHDHFPVALGDRFWLTARSFYSGMERQISAAYELWSDEASRHLFTETLEYRFSLGDAEMPGPDATVQYFPNTVPPWQSPLRFVDCGAFDGDTLKQMAGTKIPVEAIAAFEPDTANFAKLAEYIRATKFETVEQVCVFPCGVDASTCHVRFSSGQGTSSHVSESGNSGIVCVSIDEALPTFRPNLIKMDIEGAEYSALRGARRTIAEHRPGLAICLYHRPEHLWQIPLLVKHLVGNGGSYFMRCHGYSGFEVVLYWVPE